MEAAAQYWKSFFYLTTSLSGFVIGGSVVLY